MGPQWISSIWMKGIIHYWSLRWGDRHRYTYWLTGLTPRVGTLVALEADTGSVRWQWSPPTWWRPCCASDEEMVAKRMQQQPATDPLCLPDSWAQATIASDGTVYVGFLNGNLYAVRDSNGDGYIDTETEVAAYDTKAAFQGSVAFAPDMLVAAP